MLYKINQNGRRLCSSEMKRLKGGLVDPSAGVCRTESCSYYEANTGNVTGTCQPNSAGNCVCNAGSSSVVFECDTASYRPGTGVWYINR
jgi:hypothetical protein